MNFIFFLFLLKSVKFYRDGSADEHFTFFYFFSLTSKLSIYYPLVRTDSFYIRCLPNSKAFDL